MWKQLMLMLAAGALLAQPVAIISVAEGDAIITSAEHRSQPAHSLDWLQDGVSLEAAKGTRLVVAFANGRRYELGSGGRLTITADGPVSVTGPLRELEKLPPMPKLPVITMASGAAMGGVRVRDGVRLVFPTAGLSTLPEHTVLRFESADEGARYQVEIADQAGNILYQSETAARTVNVPPGALKPGQFCFWRVRGASGEVLAQTKFKTASAETIASRAAFKAAIPESDVDSLCLFAAMDAQLGLLDEAQDELRASLSRSTHPEGVRRLLDSVEKSTH